MSLTVSTTETQHVPGNQRETVSSVTFDSSYAEGGEALTAKQLGLSKVAYASCNITNGSETEEYVGLCWYVPATALIKLGSVKTGKELAKEKDVSKLVVQVRAVGY